METITIKGALSILGNTRARVFSLNLVNKYFCLSFLQFVLQGLILFQSSIMKLMQNIILDVAIVGCFCIFYAKGFEVTFRRSIGPSGLLSVLNIFTSNHKTSDSSAKTSSPAAIVVDSENRFLGLNVERRAAYVVIIWNLYYSSLYK